MARRGRPSQIDVQLRDGLEGFDGVQVVLPMTCVNDRLEHGVTEFEFGRSGGCGRYRALCGAVVVPGSMFEAPGPGCGRCLGVLYPGPAVVLVVPGRVRALGGWVRGLMGACLARGGR